MKLLAYAVLLVISIFIVSVLASGPAAAQVMPDELTDDDIFYDEEPLIIDEASLDVPSQPIADRTYGTECDPANNPPEGWLRPGGYCAQAQSLLSLTWRPANQHLAPPPPPPLW